MSTVNPVYPSDEVRQLQLKLVKALAELETYKRRLNDILAVIHRDGGHHREAVGDKQAWEDAMLKISREREERTREIYLSGR
jgi:hypothetical protein